MSGAAGVPSTLIGENRTWSQRAAAGGFRTAFAPRGSPELLDRDTQLRSRLAEALSAMLTEVTTGAIELSMVPGAGFAAVLEHRGIRVLLVLDPGTGNGYGLSPRELQIARMVAAGATNRAIADALDISLWTVSTHLRRVFAKTGVGSRAEMVAELFGGLHVPLRD
jgi:DNA-binding CsgD family transcriptional regulator